MKKKAEVYSSSSGGGNSSSSQDQPPVVKPIIPSRGDSLSKFSHDFDLFTVHNTAPRRPPVEKPLSEIERKLKKDLANEKRTVLFKRLKTLLVVLFFPFYLIVIRLPFWIIKFGVSPAITFVTKKVGQLLQQIRKIGDKRRFFTLPSYLKEVSERLRKKKLQISSFFHKIKLKKSSILLKVKEIIAYYPRRCKKILQDIAAAYREKKEKITTYWKKKFTSKVAFLQTLFSKIKLFFTSIFSWVDKKEKQVASFCSPLGKKVKIQLLKGRESLPSVAKQWHSFQKSWASLQHKLEEKKTVHWKKISDCSSRFIAEMEKLRKKVPSLPKIQFPYKMAAFTFSKRIAAYFFTTLVTLKKDATMACKALLTALEANLASVFVWRAFLKIKYAQLVSWMKEGGKRVNGQIDKLFSSLPIEKGVKAVVPKVVTKAVISSVKNSSTFLNNCSDILIFDLVLICLWIHSVAVEALAELPQYADERVSWLKL